MTFTGLTSGSDQTGAGPYTTASVALSNTALTVLAVTVGGMGGQAAGSVTVAGGSGTWTRIGHLDPASGDFNDYPTWLFTCVDCTGTGTITITATGGAAFGAWWSVVQVTGTVQPSVVGTPVTNSAAADTSLTMTLPTFAHVSNRAFGVFAQVAESAGTIPGDGFTEIHDQAAFFSGGRLMTEYGAENDATVDANTGAASGAWEGLAIEITDVGALATNDALIVIRRATE